jgi:5-deoxy-glucuronate isomerase
VVSGTSGAAPRLLVPAGTATAGDDPVVLTPEDAGWTYAGLRVVRLAAGESRDVVTGPDEVVVLPLSGSLEVGVGARTYPLRGRTSVFSGISDFVYLPIDTEARLSSAGGAEVALPGARATRRYEAARVGAEDVAVELRGAGDATRQVNNFFAPDAFEADKLVAVEVLTPEGNFSSYPPHKHDVFDAETGEVVLEEIYYFRFDRPEGYGLWYQRAADDAFELAARVVDGDVCLVPRGYHGPAAAVPGHHMYYLNVLGGPGEERSLCFRDDPAQSWIRGTWTEQQTDRRLPLSVPYG